MRLKNIYQKITINQDLCIQCLKCIRSCPAEILVKEDDNSKTQKGSITITNPDKCFECRACEVVCSVLAISVVCAVDSISTM